MSSAYFVKIEAEGMTYTFRPSELDLALAKFFGAIRDGAEAVEIRWSA